MKKRFLAFFLFLVTVVFAAESFAAPARTVSFGRYYQANSKEKTPIEWLALDETADRLLLITKDCIDEVPYNERAANVTWETCTLRKWMNGEFLNAAFSDEEKAAIIPTKLPAGKDPRYSTNPGNDTTDRVFALNCAEVVKYMPRDEDRQCVPTAYARSRGTYVNWSGNCAWWTRSPGADNTQASYLSSHGTFGTAAHYVDDRVIAARPAVWVRRSFFDFDGTAKREERSRQEIENVLYSVKPGAEKAEQAETTLFSPLEQTAPFEAKELHEEFFRSPEESLSRFDRRRFEVSGVASKIGRDIHGQPSIELSDAAGGRCYVLCVFQNDGEYAGAKVGDRVSVRGNYLVIRDDYGIVLKRCELI